MSLLIVGTVAFDRIETPFGKTDRILGGAATYAGLAASLFSRKIGLVSVVGDDFPKEYLDLLREKHIDTAGVRVVQGGKTFFWQGRYHANMNSRDTLATDLNVLADFDPVLPEAYRNSRYLLLGNLTPVIQRKVIEQMNERPALICMDTMNFWMDTAWGDLLEVLQMVDLLTINDEEARQLSGEFSLIKAARKILDMGPRYLIIKRGEYGALLFYGEDIFHSAAMLLEHVVDPTGAGDSFAGGFMGYVAARDDTSYETLKKALVYGSVVASFAVEAFGTEALTHVDAESLDARLGLFSKMTGIGL